MKGNKIDNSRLILGDCLDILPKIKDSSIDMVLCDPPYGTTACKWDTVIPFEPMWEELLRIVKDNGAICLFGSEPFSSHLRLSNIKMFKYDWYWNKIKPSNFQIMNYQAGRVVEVVSVFSAMAASYSHKGSMVYYPQKSPIVPITRKLKIYSKNTTLRDSNLMNKYNSKNSMREYKYKLPTNILKYSNASQKGKFHPTQKPVALLEYLLKTYTLEGETVLDFTAGSFSTGVAAQNLNRRFIGIEKELNYYKIGYKRLLENYKRVQVTRSIN